MSKKLKIFIFTLLGLIVAAGIGVGGYFLISNLSTTDVYNLCILTDAGNPINDTSKYLLSNSQNQFPISVDIETSGAKTCYFVSTNPQVAKVVIKEGKYYVQYYKAGSTTITAYSSASTKVYDSFKLDVYDNFISEIIIDQKEDNVLNLYGDGKIYTYSYQATGILEEEHCNNMLTRVVENYDTSIIEKITIDQATQTISIKSKLITFDSYQTFYLQTYYVDLHGKEHVVKNYAYGVNIVGYRIDDMQLVVSENYQFNNQSYVYLSDSTNVEGAFLLENEKIVSEIILSENVENLYFKIRVIYSNKTYSDVSFEDNVLPTEVEGNYLKFTGGWVLGMNYWFVQLNAQTLAANADQSDIVRFFSISYTDETVKSSISKDFKITYKYSNTQSYKDFANKDLYAKVVDVNGNFIRYEYIYWDSRFRRTDTKTDANGYIVGFINDAPLCDESKNITISE